MSQPTKQELQKRRERLYAAVKSQDDDWDFIFIASKINQYYFTGTMQNGVLVVTGSGEFLYFVRRSFERARQESPFNEHIFPMTSYRDIASKLKKNTRKLYLETETTTLATLERMGKYFDVSAAQLVSIDSIIQKLRAVKSSYELACMEESGKQHKILLEEIVPQLLYEGMNEAELCSKMYERMIDLGHHGVARFGSFQTEIMVGQLGFSENSIYPTNFDGPGGMRGMSPAVPIIGDRKRLLKKGDLVFVDVAYGYNGYHSDRTQVYMFDATPPDEAVQYHKKCMSIQKEVAARLKPGAIPSDIYVAAMELLDDEFLSRFVGTGSDRVKFLGHGIGLQVDEYPVIAQGFNEPLLENMAFAVEPKRSIPDFGMVGVEDTYLVTPEGGRCITGGEKDIIVI